METPKLRQVQYDLFDTARFFSILADIGLSERDFRLVVAAVAEAESTWNMSYIAECANVSRTTLYSGLADLRGEPLGDKSNGEKRQRAGGGGRKDILEKDPSIREDIRTIIEPHVRGSPETPLRWISKSWAKISAALRNTGHRICANTVGKVLRVMGYTRQSCKKSHENGSSPDRNAQFEFIATTVDDFKRRRQPVISVDTKKKELVGNFKNAGSDYRPKGEAPVVNVHDFVGEAGRASPYGVFDPVANEAFVNVGTCADTGEFAVESIRKWWRNMGVRRYPDATELLITADGGGSNGSRNRLWKTSLQSFATESGLRITVRHYPPGCSKWNKIEHGVFSFISQNWRGVPLVSVDTIVNLIANTTNRMGLRVFAEKSVSNFQSGVKVPDSDMDGLCITREHFHPEWNYTIVPVRCLPTSPEAAPLPVQAGQHQRESN